MSPLPPLSSAGLPPARTRGPPPSDWSWSPAAFPLDFTSLPPLPTIRSAALAAQAVTTKNYHGDLAGRPKRFTYDDEIGSYRRLEWLGDAALHPAYAKHLFRLFPEAGSGALSTIRGELHSNVTQAHLAYAYELDLKILEPRKPKNPRTFWRPLAQNQNIVADVFEAYIGALTEEDRENEVAEWVGALLERNKEQVRRRVAELIARACEPLPLSRAEYRKRSLEQNSFEGGSELDEVTKRRRISYLPTCPMRLDKDAVKPRYDDRPDGTGGWHTHLVFAEATIGCGEGKKRDQARQAAVDAFFYLATKSKDVRSALVPSGDGSEPLSSPTIPSSSSQS